MRRNWHIHLSSWIRFFSAVSLCVELKSSIKNEKKRIQNNIFFNFKWKKNFFKQYSMHATKLYKKKKDQRRGMIYRILEIKICY